MHVLMNSTTYGTYPCIDITAIPVKIQDILITAESSTVSFLEAFEKYSDFVRLGQSLGTSVFFQSPGGGSDMQPGSRIPD